VVADCSDEFGKIGELREELDDSFTDVDVDTALLTRISSYVEGIEAVVANCGKD